jgi:hypothetical protein
MRKAGFVLVMMALMLVAGCVTETISRSAGHLASPTGAVASATPNIIVPAITRSASRCRPRAQGLVEDVRTGQTAPETNSPVPPVPTALLYFRGVSYRVASDSRFHKTAHGVWIGVTWDNARAAYGDRAKVLEGRGNKKSISVPEPGTEFTVLLDFDSRAGAVPLVRRILAGNAAFLEGLFGSAAKEC